jgi:hypothetical protein
MLNKKLEEIFNQLEHQRYGLFSKVNELTTEELSSRYRPDKWNILEILTHLLTAEKLSLSYMKKKSLGINTLGNSGLYEMLKIDFFVFSQRLPLHYKAPKAVVENTVVIPFSEIEKQWLELRHELKLFLETLPDKHLKKKIYKHPFLGRLDAVQALITIREHINHHTPQIERLIKLKL